MAVKLSKTLETKLKKAKIQMLMKYPFFGNIALHLPIVPVDQIIETAGTDGKQILINVDFLKGLSDKQAMFLIAHEVMHCVYQHMNPNRVESRDHKKWNVAGDHVINNQLIEDGVGEFIEGGVCDKQWAGSVTEYVYDNLTDEEMLQYQLADCHISFDELGNPVVTTASGKTYTKEELEAAGIKIRPMTAEEAKKFDQQMKEKVAQAAEASAGTMSAGLKRLVQGMLEPKIDWRSYLCSQLSYQVKDDFSFSRPSRKCQGYDFVLPGLIEGEHVELTCAIDLSGSISDEMVQEFFTEIRGIIQMYKSFKLTIMTFDTDVYNPQTFTPETISQLDEYELLGHGGTDFMCVWDYLKEVNETPEQLVVFTDGYPCGEWGIDGFCDTLYLINGNQSIVAPFGVTIHY